jgi:hypothetical protein
MKLSRTQLGAILTIKKTGRGKTAKYSMTVPADLGASTSIETYQYKALASHRKALLNKYTPVEK